MFARDTPGAASRIWRLLCLLAGLVFQKLFSWTVFRGAYVMCVIFARISFHALSIEVQYVIMQTFCNSRSDARLWTALSVSRSSIADGYLTPLYPHNHALGNAY